MAIKPAAGASVFYRKQLADGVLPESRGRDDAAVNIKKLRSGIGNKRNSPISLGAKKPASPQNAAAPQNSKRNEGDDYKFNYFSHT